MIRNQAKSNFKERFLDISPVSRLILNKAKQSETRSTMRNAILSKSQFQKEATHSTEMDGALILEESIII